MFCVFVAWNNPNAVWQTFPRKWHETASGLKDALETEEERTKELRKGHGQPDGVSEREKDLQKQIESYERETKTAKDALAANKSKFKRYVTEREKKEAAMRETIGALKDGKGMELTNDSRSIVVTAWNDARAENDRLRSDNLQYKTLLCEAQVEIQKWKKAAKNQ